MEDPPQQKAQDATAPAVSPELATTLRELLSSAQSLAPQGVHLYAPDAASPVFPNLTPGGMLMAQMVHAQHHTGQAGSLGQNPHDAVAQQQAAAQQLLLAHHLHRQQQQQHPTLMDLSMLDAAAQQQLHNFGFPFQPTAFDPTLLAATGTGLLDPSDPQSHFAMAMAAAAASAAAAAAAAIPGGAAVTGNAALYNGLLPPTPALSGWGGVQHYLQPFPGHMQTGLTPVNAAVAAAVTTAGGGASHGCGNGGGSSATSSVTGGSGGGGSVDDDGSVLDTSVDGGEGGDGVTRRRQARNLREQRRAHKITDLIDHLKVVLDQAGFPTKSTSKYHVLNACEAYIRHLQRRAQCTAMERCLRDLVAAAPELDSDDEADATEIPDSTDGTFSEGVEMGEMGSASSSNGNGVTGVASGGVSAAARALENSNGGGGAAAAVVSDTSGGTRGGGGSSSSSSGGGSSGSSLPLGSGSSSAGDSSSSGGGSSLALGASSGGSEGSRSPRRSSSPDASSGSNGSDDGCDPSSASNGVGSGSDDGKASSDSGDVTLALRGDATDRPVKANGGGHVRGGGSGGVRGGRGAGANGRPRLDYGEIFRSSAVALAVASRDGSIIDANDRFLRETGWCSQRAVGRRLEALAAPECAMQLRDTMARMLTPLPNDAAAAAALTAAQQVLFSAKAAVLPLSAVANDSSSANRLSAAALAGAAAAAAAADVAGGKEAAAGSAAQRNDLLLTVSVVPHERPELTVFSVALMPAAEQPLAPL